MMKGILFEGIVFFIMMFAFLLHCFYDDVEEGVQRHELTLFFTTFVMIQVWNLFNAKTLGSVEYGGEMFRTDGMNWKEWAAVIGLTSIVMWVGEIWRMFKRIWKQR